LTLYPDIPSDGVPYGEFGNSTFPKYGTQWRRIASISGDLWFIGPCRLFAQYLAFHKKEKVYKYRVTLTDPLFPAMLGAAHGIEIGYVWNEPTLRLTSTAISKTVDFVSRAWASFIYDLDPNHHGLRGIPAWKPYSSSSTGVNLVIATDSFTSEDDTFRSEGIELINSVILNL
jgi:acetylcholinesterase